jgi:hypothetical protein
VTAPLSDRAKEFERQRVLAAVKRSRMRKAGLLPPLPTCPRCGSRCNTDRWLPLCSTCARSAGREIPVNRGTRARTCKPRAVRLLAEEILLQLRAEARAEAGR